MRPSIKILTSIILAISPHRTTSEYFLHQLGKVEVSVISNQKLSRIDEFDYISSHKQQREQAQAAEQTNKKLEFQLALQFDVCFPKHYCPIVTTNKDVFKEKFDSYVCRGYCDQVQYHASLKVLDVCEIGGSNNNGIDNQCINFGLTMQASSKSEAEDIYQELRGIIVSSESVWRELLNELAPQSDPKVGNPDVLGHHISRNTGETWYPAWDSGNELCSNDQNIPFYMKLDPDEYLAPTMTDCCRKHYWWNVRGCAKPENRPCPEGSVPTAEQIANEGIMSGKYFGKYPNIFYPGCIPVTTHKKDRNLEHGIEEDKEELARRRDLSHREQEQKLKSLLERQKRLEKLMRPSSQQPPVHVLWKPQRLR
mmetsp:Transcript_12651/g.30873  ORF Transcript_12651/g.30873 Transcript_12651/m.30873 type:complete len:367 (-) Transcript_12651:72-1172(-)